MLLIFAQPAYFTELFQVISGHQGKQVFLQAGCPFCHRVRTSSVHDPTPCHLFDRVRALDIAWHVVKVIAQYFIYNPLLSFILRLTSYKYPKLWDIITLSYLLLLIIIYHLFHRLVFNLVYYWLIDVFFSFVSFIAAPSICTLICVLFSFFSPALVLPFNSINYVFCSQILQSFTL